MSLKSTNPGLAARLEAIPPGKINGLKKEHLLVIAEVLGIKFIVSGVGKQNVPEMKITLNEALKNPGLAFKEELQKFIIYPRGVTAPIKNSADKTTDDALQNKSELNPPATGAHKTLLENGSTSDPPPQYKPLGGAGPKKEDHESNVVDSDGQRRFRVGEILSQGLVAPTSSSDADSEDTNQKKKDRTHKRLMKRPEIVEANVEMNKLPIVVHFVGSHDRSRSREVWIPPSQRSQISVAKASDNSGDYTAPLKTILPIALAQDSPIKSWSLLVKDGRAKLGIVGPLGPHLNLGTVDDFAGNNFPEPLALDRVNNYKLEPINGGLLCRVFWEPQNTKNETDPITTNTSGNAFWRHRHGLSV
ncbi:hypothetical protein C8R45DRAFT_1154249 [Mycena sanguinolenta]|nr:hypothetical protein C8R45DRAFT_1154249 [Mycena sanguinolenta]